MPSEKKVDDNSNGELLVTTYDHNGKFVERNYGNAIYVTKAFRVLESDSILLELEFDYLGRTRRKIVPRGHVIKKSELLRYADIGMPVSESNVTHAIDFITSQEHGEPPELIHEGIGMDIYVDEDGNEINIFKGIKAVGVKSRYVGKAPIEPKGSLKLFKEFAQKHIVETPLSLTVAFGLSALVVGFLSDVLHCESLVVHISGESTTGKSTATRLAISTGSLPSFYAKHTLMNTFDGTENALLSILLGNRGFPVCFDEADANDRKDLSQFIYRLASGRGKMRLTKEGAQKEVKSYCTTIITNGEKGLTRNSNQNTGKEIRVLQFDSIPWTESAAHAETVNRFVQEECYGVLIIYVAKYMLKIGKMEVLRRYEENRKLFIEQSYVADSFTARISGKYAFIMTAAQLANEAMDLGLPFEDIFYTLLQNEAETKDSRDIAQKAYDHLMEQININIDKFSLSSFCEELSNVDAKRDVWGIRIPQKSKLEFDGKKCEMVVCVAKEKCEDLLIRGGFQEPKIIFKKFKERGWLDCEGDRLTRKRKLTKSGTNSIVYALRVFTEDEDVLSGEYAKPKRKPLSRKIKPTIKADDNAFLEQLLSEADDADGDAGLDAPPIPETKREN